MSQETDRPHAGVGANQRAWLYQIPGGTLCLTFNRDDADRIGANPLALYTLPDTETTRACDVDAERYRFLKQCGRCDSKHAGLVIGTAAVATVAFRYWCEEALLDAAIDAARLSSGKT